MEYIVRVDDKGRVLIPKEIRKLLGIDEKKYVKIMQYKDKIVLEPIESYASKYYGVFKVRKWPEDLDEFMIEVMRRWWKEST